MNIKIMPQKSFTVPGLPETETFTLMSEWNGMKELRNAENEMLIIAVQQNSFKQILGELFNAAEPVDVAVVSGSPDLIARIHQTLPKKGVPPFMPNCLGRNDIKSIALKHGQQLTPEIEKFADDICAEYRKQYDERLSLVKQNE